MNFSISQHHTIMSAPTENRSLWRDIIISTRNIFKANFGHFHAISILFLLPIFFTLVVYPCFHLALFHPDNVFTSFSLSKFEIIVLIVYILFLVLFFLCAVATTIYSTVQAYHDRPINLVLSIKSIRNSFFPLLSTFIVSQTIFISITLLFSLVFVFLVQILQVLGLIELKYDSNHLLFLVIPTLIVLVPVLVWLQVNWSLAYAIAVIESKWGYETLRRSAKLVKGKRWVAFWIHMYYGLVIVVMVVGGALFLVSLGAAKGNQWRSFGVILQTALAIVFGYVLMNQYLMANTVLYMYCKDLNDENLPLETGSEYVSLPLNEEKNDHAIV
ncbi:uncharacterized protein LOC132642021 [Lycium barbarum]|uniref:uncharacterized protein LOC132642021 n=1 Tax=Lycium barbarum TaxID=112863 RepID=UPI00293E2BC0|nr:uncharacterized protein LOC132642021 [Lycium barbarum]